MKKDIHKLKYELDSNTWYLFNFLIEKYTEEVVTIKQIEIVMIKLVNKSKLKSEKIEKVLNLFPGKYKNSDIEVRIYKNIFSLKMIFISKISVSPADFYNILQSGVVGMYSGDKGDIVEIYLFNIPKENFCLHLTYRVLHLNISLIFGIL